MPNQTLYSGEVIPFRLWPWRIRLAARLAMKPLLAPSFDDHSLAKQPQDFVSPLRKLPPIAVNSMPQSHIHNQFDPPLLRGAPLRITVTRPNRWPVISISFIVESLKPLYYHPLTGDANEF